METGEKSFKPNEFSSSSFLNTSQKLAWYEDDVYRAKVTKRKVTAGEIEEADFETFLASYTDSLRFFISTSHYALPNLMWLIQIRSKKTRQRVTFTSGLSEVASVHWIEGEPNSKRQRHLLRPKYER